MIAPSASRLFLLECDQILTYAFQIPSYTNYYHSKRIHKIKVDQSHATIFIDFYIFIDNLTIFNDLGEFERGPTVKNKA